MLNELNIQNLGVIEKATAEFSSGLTVVTGETGAGKTMVVSSLRLLSGTRADASRIRSGMDRASVEGIFTTTSPTVAEIVEEIGGDTDGEEVIASRTLTSAGRSRAHLAGKAVAAAVLGRFASQVITIHGQNDQLRLLDPTRQMNALDSFAGIEEEVRRYRALRTEWLSLEKDLKKRLEARRELALESETLARAVEAIDAIDPQPGEDEELKQQIQVLQNADDLRTALESAIAALDGSEEDFEARGANDLIGDAMGALQPFSEHVGELKDRLREVSVLLGDISTELGQQLLDIADPDALEGMLQRQQQLRELRKYAIDADGAILWREQARDRLSKIDVSGEAIEELREKVEHARRSALEVAQQLSRSRAKAAEVFEQAVTTEINGLQMTAAIRVVLKPRGGEAGESQDADVLGPLGLEEAEFQLEQGGNINPLAGFASGGELSRVMLALEVVLAARSSGGRTMVFDEVDAGVGGKAAIEIGRRLAKLATNNQVIVVTHLPQVAAFADTHLYVAKEVSQENVKSSVVKLTEKQQVDELSRMLAGLESESGKVHAQELLSLAQKSKVDDMSASF